MDACYVYIDGFRPKSADIKGPASVPISDYYYVRSEMCWNLASKPDQGLEPASIMP